MVKVSKLEAVVGLPKFKKVEKTICGACQMGKQTKTNHQKVNVISTLLRASPQAYEKMETLCKKLQNEKGVQIVKIRSDHGKEFKNEKFESFCEKNGIKKEFSAPKTPQQNVVVERKNQVIQEMARVMLLNKQIPQKC